LIEIYTLNLNEGAVHQAGAHVAGLFEHITITAGTIEISTDAFCEVINEGDLISFRADRPHTYRVIEGPARFVSVHEYPKDQS
jgi:quercetin dioxygenase-like cupin family protein